MTPEEIFGIGPKVGAWVCDCRYVHQRIKSIDDDGDTLTLEDDHICSYVHFCSPIDHTWEHRWPFNRTTT